MPATRVKYWRAKLEGNRKRDAKQRRTLRRMGWRVLTVWECQIHPATPGRLVRRIVRFLEA